jgi:hypothetical protein
MAPDISFNPCQSQLAPHSLRYTPLLVENRSVFKPQNWDAGQRERDLSFSSCHVTKTSCIAREDGCWWHLLTAYSAMPIV